MKKINRFSFLLLIISTVFFISSCSKDSIQENPEEITTLKKELPTEVRDHFDCQGYNTHDAFEMDGHYVIENDIVFEASAIEEAMTVAADGTNELDFRQYTMQTGQVLTANNALNIRILIDPSVGAMTNATTWEADIITAVNNWANISGCRLNFIFVTQTGPPVSFLNSITFFADNSRSRALPRCMSNLAGIGLIGRSFFPSAGRPGRIISLTSTASLTQAHRVSLIMHEMGHALGFRHSNAIALNEGATSGDCGPATGLPVYLHGTPTDDPNSNMRQGFTSSNTTFSTGDIRASRLVYPSGWNSPVISSYQILSQTQNTRLVKLNLQLGPIPYYKFRIDRMPPWSSTPVQSDEFLAIGNSFSVNSPLGTWTFKVVGLNYAEDLQLGSSPININVN